MKPDGRVKMFDELTILKDASALARHSALRHQVIAENIANANTPGYRAKDVEDFKAVYSANQDNLSKIEWRAIEDPGSAVAAPNGNTVSLQEEMARSAQASDSHDAALAIYRKTLDILRISLGR